MSLTRNQIHERFRDLSGEIKAAHTAIADCAADCEAKDKMAEIARQALDKAKANLATLYEERARLAQAYSEQAMTVGEDAAQELDTSVSRVFESQDIWGNPVPLVEGAGQPTEWRNAYTNGIGGPFGAARNP